MDIMNWQDVVNGFFELVSGLFIFANCYKLYKDKCVKGVYVLPTVFFFLWGCWNLYYYPHLEQWVSFVSGLTIVASNGLWVAMVMYYNQKPKPFNLKLDPERWWDNGRK